MRALLKIIKKSSSIVVPNVKIAKIYCKSPGGKVMSFCQRTSENINYKQLHASEKWDINLSFPSSP